MQTNMPVNPSFFNKANVIDTCAIWNLLSSKLLYTTALQVKCSFCITDVIYYECLVKPRSKSDSIASQLEEALRLELQNEQIKKYSLDIEDLQNIELINGRKRYGRGELSAVALARKFGIAVMTDDGGARKLAAHNLTNEKAQIVPHLLGWLLFEGILADKDAAGITDEHLLCGGNLAPHFQTIYQRAMEYRLRASSPS